MQLKVVYKTLLKTGLGCALLVLQVNCVSINNSETSDLPELQTDATSKNDDYSSGVSAFEDKYPELLQTGMPWNYNVNEEE